MPTGEGQASIRRPKPRPRFGERARGYTYLAVLFLVALTAAGLARLGQAWSTAAEREREAELAWRGADLARAIASYAAVGGPAAGRYPTRLEDLLEDRRGPGVRRHLRRVWADPFTGEADWVLVSHPMQPDAFQALHSRSDHRLLREATPAGSPIKQASDWVFSALPAAPAASAAARP
jgi:type II secretory pathway pseudopilin PulG